MSWFIFHQYNRCGVILWALEINNAYSSLEEPLIFEKHAKIFQLNIQSKNSDEWSASELGWCIQKRGYIDVNEIYSIFRRNQILNRFSKEFPCPSLRFIPFVRSFLLCIETPTLNKGRLAMSLR